MSEELFYLTGKFRMNFSEPAQCPRCLAPLPEGFPGPASRYDLQTEICSGCLGDELIEINTAKRINEIYHSVANVSDK